MDILKAKTWSGASWLLTLCISFTIVLLLYATAHCFIKGSEYTPLSKEQMQNINNLLIFSPDTIKTEANNTKVDPAKTALIISYLESEYANNLDKNDSIQINTLLVQFSAKDASIFLSQKRFKVSSYFWLTGTGAYGETLFWSLIGVLASLIYYVSITNKAKIESSTDEDGCVFNPAEIPPQVAKMFYAPVCTLVIVLGYSLIKPDNSLLDLNAGKGLILFSFLAGFFSSRLMKFLDGLKKLILPIGNSGTGDASNTNKETAKDENPKDAIPDEIFREALEEKGLEWKDKFAPVESISIGKKKVNGIETEKWCLQFNVTVKQEDLSEDKKIPPFIEYTSKKNEKYSLPTDVNGVGKTTNDSCYRVNNDITTGRNLSTKLLGISCSRKGNINTGTIGLKVKKAGSNKTYLLSCYHVLCDNEIKAGKFQLGQNEITQDSEIISPGLLEGGTNTVIANVKEGFVDGTLDIAIAELTDDKLLDDRIYSTSTHASTFFVVSNSQVRPDYKITMVGRSSGKQTGHLESAFANVTIGYPTVANPGNKIEIKGVLMACKISIPGDSGAAVFDEKNNIIGVVFASNDENTYILPIFTILDHLQVTLA